jgi:hypothetical protein
MQREISVVTHVEHPCEVIPLLLNRSRVFEFYTWEKNIREQKSYLGVDVPILDYLHRLAVIGEDISKYETIWYYF